MKDNRESILEIIKRLELEYPDARCTLSYEKDYELLISVRLAAQCTDERVNKITPALFKAYPTLLSIAEAHPQDIEPYIKSCGFFRAKAKDIVESSKMIISDFSGVVPSTMEELLRLPGVGRKTANLILGDIYDKPSSVVVDTHCIRLSNRLGLVETKDPQKIEFSLRQILPAEKSNDFCHRLVLHGRTVCRARSPLCSKCCLREICPTP